MNKVFSKLFLPSFLVLITFSFSASAKQTVTVKYPAIYPFVSTDTDKIYTDVKTVTEDPNFIRNFQSIISNGYSAAKTSTKPWTSSYWPLSKGTIADPYENSSLGYNVDIGWVNWKDNYKSLKKRQKKVHPFVSEMSQEELDNLAPSEKYDILIGDSTFDYTKRLIQYMHDWGKAKENSFITKINLTSADALERAEEYVKTYRYFNNVEEAFRNSYVLLENIPAQKTVELLDSGKYSSVREAFPAALQMSKKEISNYVLEKKNSRMAAWEGICNGWSTGAGIYPRPRKTVSINLPNGKKLNFYPSDIKGLISSYFFNSVIQDPAQLNKKTRLPKTQGTVSAGLRCNLKNAKEDLWGRKYDHEDDPFNGGRQPRCSGVHPATWHLGLVNLIGKQDRSFIVERKVGSPVDNHPMYGYKMKYFNPNKSSRKTFDPKDKKSKYGFEDVVVAIDENDQFKQFRNKKAKYIVGVETTMIYIHYKRPNRKKTNDEDDDSEVKKEMFYDLELDENYNIVGGQWRAVKVGQPTEKKRGNHNQPDFFWAITKDYNAQGIFSNKTLEYWADKTKLPPASWLEAAKLSHSFEYKLLIDWQNAAYCRMKNKKTEKYKKVLCEQSYNKPQPLINVVNTLVDLSK